MSSTWAQYSTIPNFKKTYRYTEIFLWRTQQNIQANVFENIFLWHSCWTRQSGRTRQHWVHFWLLTILHFHDVSDLVYEDPLTAQELASQHDSFTLTFPLAWSLEMKTHVQVFVFGTYCCKFIIQYLPINNIEIELPFGPKCKFSQGTSFFAPTKIRKRNQVLSGLIR